MMKIYHSEYLYVAATIGWGRNHLKSFAFYPALATGILPRCSSS